MKKFLKVFFTKVNLAKIIIIFSIGLISRIFIHYLWDVNVFIDFLHPISITFYFMYSSIIVFINELFSFYIFSVLPNIGELFSGIPKFFSLLSSLSILKFEYFKFSSIRQFFIYLYSKWYSYFTITHSTTLDNTLYTLDDSLVLEKNNKSDIKGESSKGKGTTEEGGSGKGKGSAHSEEGESSKGKSNKGKSRASPFLGESSKGRTIQVQEESSNRIFNGQTPIYGSNWDRNTSFENPSLEELKLRDKIRRRCHWFFLHKFNNEYSSYNDFKKKWNVNSVYLYELNRQINNDIYDVKHRIKLSKKTVGWFFNRRNP